MRFLTILSITVLSFTVLGMITGAKFAFAQNKSTNIEDEENVRVQLYELDSRRDELLDCILNNSPNKNECLKQFHELVGKYKALIEKRKALHLKIEARDKALFNQ